MQITKQELRDFAAQIGVDLIGFAARDRFADVPAEVNPFSIAPEAKTVIVMGKRITRGTLRGTEEGTNFSDYNLFGIQWLDMDYVAEGCYNLVRYIEDRGWEAVPVFSNPSAVAGYGVPVRDGAPVPDVIPDFNYAAVACGLGVIGVNGLFLSKKYGPRQKLQMIITDAEFESDPLVTQTICDQCGSCQRGCPLGAISQETILLDVCGLKMPVAEVDASLCRMCKNGAMGNRVSSRGEPDRCAALCGRNCMIHLEEAGLIENTFENSFRRRKTWAIDIRGKNVEPQE